MNPNSWALSWLGSWGGSWGYDEDGNPIVDERQGGGGSSSSRKKSQARADARLEKVIQHEDEIILLSIITAITRGIVL